MPNEKPAPRSKPVTDVAIPSDFSHNLDLSDISLPSIILWQSMTDVEGLTGEPGEFVNSVTTTNYGKELLAYVVDVWKTARLYGGEDNREIVRFSSDAKHWDDDGSEIPASMFRFRNGEPPEAATLYHYLVIIPDENIPAVITFKGASTKNGKNLNTLLSITRPYWKNAFKFVSHSTQNEKGKFEILQAVLNPKAPSRKIAKMCEEFFHINRTARVKSYETDEVLEEPPESPDEDPEVPF